MQFDWWTLALQTFNFAVLVWLLRRFLYKPVLAMVDARRAEIAKQYADARATEANARSELAAITAERAGIAAEREAALKSAEARAEEAASARRVAAERAAAALLDSARKALAKERDTLMAEARRLAFDLGADVARRLLAEVPMGLRAEIWLDRIEQHLVALPKPELDTLIRQVAADGAVLTVVTAAMLPAESAEAWRTRLGRCVGEDAVIAFEVSPALIAGAELHFPSAVIRFSWQSALAAVRSEIDVHGDARG